MRTFFMVRFLTQLKVKVTLEWFANLYNETGNKWYK